MECPGACLDAPVRVGAARMRLGAARMRLGAARMRLGTFRCAAACRLGRCDCSVPWCAVSRSVRMSDLSRCGERASPLTCRAALRHGTGRRLRAGLLADSGRAVAPRPGSGAPPTLNRLGELSPAGRRHSLIMNGSEKSRHVLLRTRNRFRHAAKACVETRAPCHVPPRYQARAGARFTIPSPYVYPPHKCTVVSHCSVSDCRTGRSSSGGPGQSRPVTSGYH